MYHHHHDAFVVVSPKMLKLVIIITIIQCCTRITNNPMMMMVMASIFDSNDTPHNSNTNLPSLGRNNDFMYNQILQYDFTTSSTSPSDVSRCHTKRSLVSTGNTCNDDMNYDIVYTTASSSSPNEYMWNTFRSSSFGIPSSASSSSSLSSSWNTMINNKMHHNKKNNKDFPTTTTSTILLNFDNDSFNIDEENDDEEDDDHNNDDDGQSSMLSTNIVSRKKLLARSSLGIPSFRTMTSSSSSSPIYTLRGGSISTSTSSTTLLLKRIMDNAVTRNLLVSAIVTLVFEACMGHILEFIKIVMQTSNDPNISYLQVIRAITNDKGIFGLWDGFCPWGIIQSIFKGAVFGFAHAYAKQVLQPLVDQQYIPLALALTLAGGIGGGFQGYVLSPTLLLKTRVMTNPVFREKMSALRTTILSFTIGYDVVKREGIGALMKGSNVFATKRVFDWASRYFFADMFEDIFAKLLHNNILSDLSVTEKSAASLLGGVFSTIVTLPLDVLVAKTQDAKKAGIKVSPIKLFLDELHEKGWVGIRNAYMRGFEARLLHVCLTTVVIKTGTPIAYEAMFGSK